MSNKEEKWASKQAMCVYSSYYSKEGKYYRDKLFFVGG